MMPRNLDLLASIRRQGMRPVSPVIVRLDAQVDRLRLHSDLPINIEAGISPDLAIDSIELWPLCGLSVAIFAPAVSERLRDLAKAVQKVSPEFVVIATPGGIVSTWNAGRGWEKAA